MNTYKRYTGFTKGFITDLQEQWLPIPGFEGRYEAIKFNISSRTAGRIVKLQQFDRKGLKIKTEDIQTILQLRESGETLLAISTRFNCGISQIHRITKGMSRNVKFER
jgi:DNA invertase Pin-like site-specific DNA recombinase